MVLQTLKRLIPDQHPLRLMWHKKKALEAAKKYGFPAKELKIIGVTGTDGKTTTVGMIAHILHENGIKVGALSTAFFRIKDHVEWNTTQKTSPSPEVIQKFLRKLVDEGCTHAVLEYSSHGLVQGRMDHTWPIVAGITNISPEHLDYHKTMEEYIRAKSLLFKMLPELSTMKGARVLHYGDPSYGKLCGITTWNMISYCEEMRDADDRTGPPMNLWLEDAKTTAKGSEATLVWKPDQPPHLMRFPLTLPIPGSFNLENALCAIGCVKGLENGPAMDGILKALASFKGIPGRLERIEEGQDFHVFVDFTVTPKSYEKTLSTLKASLEPGKRLLVLTGSCGDRMKEKRPVVGKIVSGYADVMVVANEDPYTEDPQKIIDEVWAGVDQSKTEAHKIFDRKEAIEFLLKNAKSGDIVVLCGKGSDTTMWTKDGQIPWNEREIVRELLRKMKN